jgi:salicylate hydroxylase
VLIGREVAVLGAGVAGLTVARALALRGAHVTVYEQAERLAEVGAGLQITPNGTRVLRALGLGDRLAAAGVAAAGVELRDGRDGGLVARIAARGEPGGYRFVHRADLIDILADGARAAGVQLRLMQRITEARPGPEGLRLITAQGAEFAAGLVIGADGLHSVVRAALNGPARPAFTGQVAWRATIPESPGAPPVAEVHMGPGRHLVTYPLRGGTLRNLVAVEERRAWVEESWSLRDDPPALALAFEGFGPRVRDWLARVETVWLWGLFRHPVAPSWYLAGPGDTGAAILGDAAHPTLPFLAQGANMALEDAWVLAACLAGHDTTAAALAAYQEARAARAARIVAAAARNAWAFHLRGPVRDVAHLGLRALGRFAPDALAARFDWLYGHDVTAAAPLAAARGA